MLFITNFSPKKQTASKDYEKYLIAMLKPNLTAINCSAIIATEDAEPVSYSHDISILNPFTKRMITISQISQPADNYIYSSATKSILCARYRISKTLDKFVIFNCKNESNREEQEKIMEDAGYTPSTFKKASYSVKCDIEAKFRTLLSPNSIMRLLIESNSKNNAVYIILINEKNQSLFSYCLRASDNTQDTYHYVGPGIEFYILTGSPETDTSPKAKSYSPKVIKTWKTKKHVILPKTPIQQHSGIQRDISLSRNTQYYIDDGCLIMQGTPSNCSESSVYNLDFTPSNVQYREITQRKWFARMQDISTNSKNIPDFLCKTDFDYEEICSGIRDIPYTNSVIFDDINSVYIIYINYKLTFIPFVAINSNDGIYFYEKNINPLQTDGPRVLYTMSAIDLIRPLVKYVLGCDTDDMCACVIAAGCEKTVAYNIDARYLYIRIRLVVSKPQCGKDSESANDHASIMNTCIMLIFTHDGLLLKHFVSPRGSK